MACIDIVGTTSLCDCRLFCSDRVEMEAFILEITAAISIPSKT